jgi:uncharacterized peroxidase-related enzyme
MSRIQPINRKNADAKSSNLLNAVEKQMGTIPNMFSTMANSLPVLQAYLGFNQHLSAGSLPPALREQIALTVSEANQCDYCLSAHSLFGRKSGLSETDLLDARHGTAVDGKANAALAFARKIVQDRGHVSDEDLEEVRRAGYSDGEISEIVAHVALSTFTNYFNRVADTDIDFPAVHSLAMA